MKHFIKLFAYLLIVLLLVSCTSKQRYKPVVRYQQPSDTALKTILTEKKGKPYRYAGQGPNRFDCSGLTYYSYASMNLWLPRRSIDQAKHGKTVPIEELRYGDLIFFDTRKHPRGKINHVGIYTGNGKFTHASSSKRRVITTNIHKPYYRKRIVTCKRVIPPKTEVKTHQEQLAAFDGNKAIAEAIDKVPEEAPEINETITIVTPEPIVSMKETATITYRQLAPESGNLF